jgi:hypothetical protein
MRKQVLWYCHYMSLHADMILCHDSIAIIRRRLMNEIIKSPYMKDWQILELWHDLDKSFKSFIDYYQQGNSIL